jgi:hypothetical protein
LVREGPKVDNKSGGTADLPPSSFQIDFERTKKAADWFGCFLEGRIGCKSRQA